MNGEANEAPVDRADRVDHDGSAAHGDPLTDGGATGVDDPAAGWSWRHSVAVLGVLALLMGAAILGWWVARVTAARPVASIADLSAPLTTEEQNALLSSFRLPTLDGRELGPPDYRGRVVVLDFWATWCGPCRAQSRILSGLLEEYSDRGVVILGVNVAEPDELVETFLADEPSNWPTLLDRDGSLSAALEVFGLPTVIVLDPEGRVAQRSPGLTGTRNLRAAIDAALERAAGSVSRSATANAETALATARQADP